jgi:hypothetical protein
MRWSTIIALFDGFTFGAEFGEHFEDVHSGSLTQTATG